MVLIVTTVIFSVKIAFLSHLLLVFKTLRLVDLQNS
jgi:hypothetical protein